MSTFDPTKPVQTRDGRKAVILPTLDLDGAGSYPITAACEKADGWEVDSFTADGNTWDGEERDSDLINIPEVHPYLKGTRTWYLNLGKGLSTLDGAMESTSFDWPVMSVTIADGKVVSTELFDDTGKPC